MTVTVTKTVTVNIPEDFDSGSDSALSMNVACCLACIATVQEMHHVAHGISILSDGRD